MDSSIDRNLWGLAISRSVASVPSIVGSAFIIQYILRRRRRRRRHPHPHQQQQQQQQQQGRQLVTLNRNRRRRDDGRRIGSSSSSSVQRDDIMLGMCTMDLVYSLVNACSSVPVPSQLSSVYKFAVGNWTTCEVFGFVGQFTSISSVVYNGSLTLYYFLTIRNDRRRGRCQRNSSQSSILTIQACNVVEFLMHFLPILVGLTTAIIALLLDLYNPIPTGCTIVSFPLNCDNGNPNNNRADETELMTDGSDSLPSSTSSSCIRGGNAPTLFIPLVSVWVWTTFFFMVIALSMIYVKIENTARTPNFTSSPSRLLSSPSVLISNAFRRPPSNDSLPNSNESELNVNRSSISTSRNNSKKLLSLKRQFATQALLYCVVFAITWLPGLLIRRLAAWFELQPGFGIAYVHAILVPLQGFWNAFVYIRPTYLKHRRRQREQQQQKQQQQEREEELPQNVGERSDISRGRAHDIVVESRSRVQALIQALSVNDDAADAADDDEDDDSMDKNDDGQE